MLLWEAVPGCLCSISHFQVEFSILNWHFFASQFLCPYFGCSFILVSIPFVSSSILEGYRFHFRLPLLGSFLFLFQSPVGRQVPHPHCSSLSLFAFSVHLSCTGVSRAVVGIPAKVLLCNWNPASFCWKSLSGGCICIFQTILHLNFIVIQLLAQTFHLMSSHLLTFQQCSPEQPQVGLRECFEDFALILLSSLIRHPPPSFPSTTEGPTGSFRVYMLL